MKVMQVPPKTARAYAQRARDGQADRYISGGAAEFYVGNIFISIRNYERPELVEGVQAKLSTAAMADLRKEAAAQKKAFENPKETTDEAATSAKGSTTSPAVENNTQSTRYSSPAKSVRTRNRSRSERKNTAPSGG